MNKYLTIAAGAALLCVGAVGMSTPAHAQAAASGPFQDVPADHWAYAAVNTLQKAGIVIGYPDGTYGGRRAMTRYEFAEAIARLLPQINNIDTSQFAKAADLTQFETDTNAKLATDEAALAAMKALVDEFQPELTKMGTDIAAVKSRLDADENRLAAVEAEQKRVHITGDANFIMRDNLKTSNNGNAPLDQDGFRSGTSKSFWTNPNVYNDVLLTIDGKVSDTSDVIVKIDATNYNAIGSYDAIVPGGAFGFGAGIAGAGGVNAPAGGAEGFNIFRAYYDTPVNIGIDSAADLQVGRLSEQFTPLTLKAVMPDAYVSLPEDSNGDIGVDGAKLNFSAGPVKANVYAGKTPAGFLGAVSDVTNIANGSNRPGSFTQGGVTGVVAIDQSAGAHLTFGFDSVNIGVTALLARVNDPSNGGGGAGGFGTAGQAFDPWSFKPINTLAVYGINGSAQVPGINGLGIDGEFAISQTGVNSQLGNVNSTHGNEAYNANLSYTLAGVGLKAGYEAIYSSFEAPGYWGRIGSWSNPTNVQGAVLSANYAATPALSLAASGNILTGLNNAPVGTSPLGKKDTLNSFKVDGKYAINNAYNLDLGYEYVQWKLKGQTGVAPGTATEGYTTIGVGHSFNSNATLKLLYQIVNFGAGATGTSFDPAGSTNGGIAVSQLEVKF